MHTIAFEGSNYPVQDHESALEALIRGGAPISYSCRKGSCHACMLRVHDGDLGPGAQRGLSSALAESGHFLPCCCYPASDLVVGRADLRRVLVRAQIRDKQPLSATVTKLLLEPETTFDWEPGQYLNLRRSDGLTRSYSIASIAEEDFLIELHVKRLDNGRMSGWIHDDLAIGDAVEIQGPFGGCVYRHADAGRELLLLGTGTGLAPLIGIAREALRHGHHGPIRLYHGTRSWDELYLHAALQRLVSAYPNFEYVPCLSTTERAVRVTDAAFAARGEAAGSVVYLCGNPDMVYEGRYRAVLAGVTRADILADPFNGGEPYWPRDAEKLRATPPDPELWAALDEGRKLRAILEDFYAQVYDDPKLAPFFHNVTMDRAISKQYEFLCRVFASGRQYFGLHPFNAHHWMVISDELFDYREELFEACVRRHGIPDPLVRRWCAFHELFRREIVKSSERGMIFDGREHLHVGYSVESIDIGTMCDGCAAEIAAGSTVRMHRRSGQIFCCDCQPQPEPVK